MSILNNIGNTPLVEIGKIWKSKNDVRIFAKVEGMNPGGSIKDRIAREMILNAIAKGDLLPSMEVIEATSGNTAIGLAMVCAALGYKCTLVMPKKVSKERFVICRAYGTNIISVNGNMDDAIAYTELMLKRYNARNKGHLLYNLNQFENSVLAS